MVHVIAAKEGYESERLLQGALHLRVQCYHILDKIPDDGLQETLTMLSEHLEFYSLQRNTSIPATTEVRGTIIETKERPPLYLDEG